MPKIGHKTQPITIHHPALSERPPLRSQPRQMAHG
jgi:hypothetical protein